MSALEALPRVLLENFLEVLRYPLASHQRLYWGYLLSSLVLASVVYLRRRPNVTRGVRDFLRFCAPREVWSSPSAWLDVRYFFVHQTFRVWIYGGFRVGVMLTVFEGLSGWLQAYVQAPTPQPITWLDRAIVLAVAIPTVDLAGYGVHALQHRVPWLWAFHKVHHSLEVMHPLSNYREHWVDNLGYGLARGVVEGLTVSAVFFWLGHAAAPTVEVLGINAVSFVYNAAGYNLRHSHVWLAWPRWLAPWLGSPAYHQLHHSALPEHRGCNLAFQFPVWDRLFGTQLLPPRDPPALVLGIGDGTDAAYDSILRLYFLPFRELFAGRRRRVSAARPVAR